MRRSSGNAVALHIILVAIKSANLGSDFTQEPRGLLGTQFGTAQLDQPCFLIDG